MTNTVKIRNRNTGEVKTVSKEDLSKYVAAPAPMEQPQQEQQPQGDFMDRLLQSRTLPIAGSVVGGGVGALAGPATGIAGAGAGYAGGDVIRKQLANLKGTPGVGAQEPTQSVVETAKGAGIASVSQAIGEGIGYGLKFLKPGTVTSFLAKANDLLAKKTGFGKIPKDVIRQRFVDEVLPKAMRFTQGQGEDVLQAGSKMISNKIETVEEGINPLVDTIKSSKIFDAEDLNFLRKNLNAIGEGAEGMKKALLDGLAKIVREEQVKLAPATGVSLPLQQAAYKIPEALKAFWPTRMMLMASDALRSVGSGLMSKFAKYGGGPLIGGSANNPEEQMQ